MNVYAMKVAAIALLMMSVPLCVQAAEITLLVSNAFKSAMEGLAPQFEKASGHKLMITYGSTNTLRDQIGKGEVFDLTILSDAAIDNLIKQGRLVAPSRTVIASSGMGVAIRSGAPRPNIDTTEEFKRALINAKSIAYLEQGLTGVYLKGLFQRLGIAEVLKPKTKYARAGEAVSTGAAELGITQISEILPIAGVELAGPLPSEIQSYALFVAAVGANVGHADAAEALRLYLVSPNAVSVMKANGLGSAPPAPGGQ